jgi:hypothetical protein
VSRELVKLHCTGSSAQGMYGAAVRRLHVFSAEAGWGLAVDDGDVGGQKYVADVDPLVAGGGSHDLTDGAFPRRWNGGAAHTMLSDVVLHRIRASSS